MSCFLSSPVKHNGNITMDQVIDTARIMRPRSMSRYLSGTVKEILGTCQSVGCTVDGAHPHDKIDEINDGSLVIPVRFKLLFLPAGCPPSVWPASPIITWHFCVCFLVCGGHLWWSCQNLPAMHWLHSTVWVVIYYFQQLHIKIIECMSCMCAVPVSLVRKHLHCCR